MPSTSKPDLFQRILDRLRAEGIPAEWKSLGVIPPSQKEQFCVVVPAEHSGRYEEVFNEEGMVDATAFHKAKVKAMRAKVRAEAKEARKGSGKG